MGRILDILPLMTTQYGHHKEMPNSQKREFPYFKGLVITETQNLPINVWLTIYEFGKYKQKLVTY